MHLKDSRCLIRALILVCLRNWCSLALVRNDGQGNELEKSLAAVLFYQTVLDILPVFEYFTYPLNSQNIT